MIRSLVFAAALLVCTGAQADPAAFSPGPLIAEYGAVARVEGAALPADAAFQVAFDVAAAGDANAVNRRLESAARFLNMHAAAGVPAGNIAVAVVVHGGAARDLTREPRPGETNPNAALIAALVANGVEIYLCGQAAAHYDITADDLLPGVRMSLSAMTAHALLQQRGYTLNPF